MTREELLKPRYKVIADYPFNIHCAIGEVICLNNKNHNNPFIRYGDDFAWYEADFDSFPNIFRKLEWWEERDENDMPEYLKGYTCIYKVAQYDFSDNTIYIAKEGLIGDDDRALFTLKTFVSTKTPATEEEYLKSQIQ